ncbi:MAG: alpha/beta fold hydrolase [Novosphingobium sp.]|nr:alpha/beta fold hydrolase [Novosphingobium sp.]
MAFVVSLRSPSNERAIGKVRYLDIDDATGTVTTRTADNWASRVIACFEPRPVAGKNKPQRVGEILFLVHGFNVSAAAALAFHRKVERGLHGAGWQGMVISFDWPSDGLVFAYLDDRVDARAAASALTSSAIGLLEARQSADCIINVHVLAHSMGCFVTQQAVTWAYQDVRPAWRIGQVMLVAADVDESVFAADNTSAKSFAQYSGRLTAYVNKYDKALLASNAKRLTLAPRLGRVGLPDAAPPLMCEVDCSDLFKSVSTGIVEDLSPVATHCFYFDQPQFWRDAALTLMAGLDRSVIPTRLPNADKAVPNRFVLNKTALSPDDYGAAMGRARVDR